MRRRQVHAHPGSDASYFYTDNGIHSSRHPANNRSHHSHIPTNSPDPTITRTVVPTTPTFQQTLPATPLYNRTRNPANNSTNYPDFLPDHGNPDRRPDNDCLSGKRPQYLRRPPSPRLPLPSRSPRVKSTTPRTTWHPSIITRPATRANSYYSPLYPYSNYPRGSRSPPPDGCLRYRRRVQFRDHPARVHRPHDRLPHCGR